MASEKNVENAGQGAPSSGPMLEGYIGPVIGLFVAGIPLDAREDCVLADGECFPANSDTEEQNAFLCRFVEEKLKRIASYEYERWLNGRMPFVTFREIQIWRLRQFAQFIWLWSLPDDDVIAAIFNLTKRRASNLIGDFHARFGKIYLLPHILERWFKILDGEPYYDETKSGISGSVWVVPSQSYLREINTIISELKSDDLTGEKGLVEAKSVSRSPRFVWLSKQVVNILRTPRIQARLRELHPIEGNDSD